MVPCLYLSMCIAKPSAHSAPMQCSKERHVKIQLLRPLGTAQQPSGLLRARLRRICSRRSCRSRRPYASFFPSPQVYLALADVLPSLFPALCPCLATLCGELRKRRPVYAVVVLEVDFAAGILHELRSGNVVGEGLVVAYLGLCDRVDEGGDELQKGGDVPGYFVRQYMCETDEFEE